MKNKEMNIKTFSILDIKGDNEEEVQQSVELYKKMGYVVEHSINWRGELTVRMSKDNS